MEIIDKILDTIKVESLSLLLKILVNTEKHFVRIKRLNYPEVEQFILSMWHGEQCVVYNVKNRSRMHVLISVSLDGEMISRAAKSLGLNVIRGGVKRGGTSATLKMLEKLEQGDNVSIAVDGPKGPVSVVKKGIINIAKISQVPIVPVVWVSPSKLFLKFPSWDSFRFPIGLLDTIAVYGEPIYVPQDCDDEQIEVYRKTLEERMFALKKDANENLEEYLKSAK